MTRGLSDKSELREEIVKVDETHAKRYRVVEEKIDLGRLKKELASWQEMPEPTKEELIELGKMSHEYYMQRDAEIERLQIKLAEFE